MDWKTTARTFNDHAAEYDSWFENSPLFEIELEALQAAGNRLPHPKLEIGMGPGRFAEKLKVDVGIDPAISALQLATPRSIIAVNAIGENLPFRTGSIGTAYILFTLCFLPDPAAVFAECRRTIKPDGRLVVGFIPARSSWGKLLTEKGKKNHPFYRHARMRTIADSIKLLESNGFTVNESWSTLSQEPGDNIGHETPRPVMDEYAGFCVLVTSKKGDSR